MTNASATRIELKPLAALHTSHWEQGGLAQLHRWLSLFAGEPCDVERCRDALADRVIVERDGQMLAETSEQALDLASTGNLQIMKFVEPRAFVEPGAPVVLEIGLLLDSDSDQDWTNLRVEFENVETIEPRIARMSYTQGDAPTGDEFKPCASRILSVNHRWHALVEDPQRTPEPFRKIIADNFAMEFGHGAVRSYDELSKWVKGSASSVAAARHDLAGFRAEKLEAGRAKAEFVLDWQGLSHEQKRMVAQTRHTWTVRDDAAARFPLIEHINVEFLTPFTTLD